MRKAAAVEAARLAAAHKATASDAARKTTADAVALKATADAAGKSTAGAVPTASVTILSLRAACGVYVYVCVCVCVFVCVSARVRGWLCLYFRWSCDFHSFSLQSRTLPPAPPPVLAAADGEDAALEVRGLPCCCTDPALC